MDPKQASTTGMDPKLQEIYDRVMGTTTANTQTSATPMQTDPANQPPTVSTPTDPTGLPTQPTISTNQTANATPPTSQPATDQPISLMSIPLDQTLQSVPLTQPQPNTVDPIPLTGVPNLAASTPIPTQQTTQPLTDTTTVPHMPNMPTIPLTSNEKTAVSPIPLPPDDLTKPVDIPNPTDPTHPETPATDALRATMNMPSVAPQETVQIGLGGSPVAATTKAKGKGISPVVLIFGALVFLLIYAISWVKFFGLKLPFLP